MLIGLAGLVLGFLLGQHSELERIVERLDALAPHTPVLARGAAEDAAHANVQLGTVDFGPVTRRLDALADACAAKPAASLPSSEPEAAPATSEAVEAARGEAEDVLDEALARGTWSDADVRRFRVQAARLPDEQREELVGSLASAINTNRLRVSVTGVPW